MIVIGIDPGGREVGAILRDGDTLLDHKVIVRKGDTLVPAPGDPYWPLFLHEVASTVRAWRTSRDTLVTVEGIADWHVTSDGKKGQRRRNMSGLFGTAAVLGVVLLAERDAVVVPPGGGARGRGGVGVSGGDPATEGREGIGPAPSLPQCVRRVTPRGDVVEAHEARTGGCMTYGNGHDTDARIPDQEFVTRGYGTDPTTLLLDLSGWARRLNELSVELAEATTKLAEAKHNYKYEAAMARERAKYRNARDRRTNADLDADVTRSSVVEPLALELCRLEAQREALLVLVDNARMQVAALRTHAERG